MDSVNASSKNEIFTSTEVFYTKFRIIEYNHRMIYTVFFTNTAVHMIAVCLEELLIFLTGPSLLPRLWQGPLSPYSGGRGCSDTVPLQSSSSHWQICAVSSSGTTGSEEEASTCRCLWVIILGLKALYKSQDLKDCYILWEPFSHRETDVPFFLHMHILWW